MKYLLIMVSTPYYGLDIEEISEEEYETDWKEYEVVYFEIQDKDSD